MLKVPTNPLRAGAASHVLEDVQSESESESGVRPSIQRVPVISAARYEGLMRTAIREWKYDGTLEITAWFADWVANAFGDYVANQTGTAANPARGTVANAKVRFDAIVPVPTSIDRYRKRGYDHVGLLAQTLAPRLGLPIWHVLIRNPKPGDDGFTQSQTAKSARDRLKGLKGVYVPSPNAGDKVRGKRVVLLDDIVTTGATLYACAAALFAAGVGEVTCIAIAQVE